MAASMIKHLCRINYQKLSIQLSLRRCLLSAGYSCQDAWKQQLQSPLLQKVDAYKFALGLQETIDKTGRVTAVDMDIMANKVHAMDRLQLDFVQDLFLKFRRTKDSVKVYDSMSHALFRALLEFDETDRIMLMLKDKINYGIFLDDYMANILMDYFIQHKRYKDAADVATDLMLQECLAHPITRVLSWYSAHLRLTELCAENVVLDDCNEILSVDEDVKYRRVKFISEPWYDDHFDIPAEHQRLGKTIVYCARLETNQDVLTRGFHLVGCAFYRKFEDGLKLMQTWADGDLKDVVHRSQLEQFKTLLEGVTAREAEPAKDPGLLTLRDLYPFITAEKKTEYLQRFEALSAKLTASPGKVVESPKSAGELLERHVNNVIAQVEPIDEKDQQKLYSDWARDRDALLQEQVKRIKTEQKKLDVARRLLELKTREEKLRYFDEQSKMDLAIADQPKIKPIEDVVEEEQFVAPPSERPKSGADAMKKK